MLHKTVPLLFLLAIIAAPIKTMADQSSLLGAFQACVKAGKTELNIVELYQDVDNGADDFVSVPQVAVQCAGEAAKNLYVQLDSRNGHIQPPGVAFVTVRGKLPTEHNLLFGASLGSKCIRKLTDSNGKELAWEQQPVECTLLSYADMDTHLVEHLIKERDQLALKD